MLNSHKDKLVCVQSHFNHVQPFMTLGTVACQSPLPWDSLGKNTGVGCHFLLQEIFAIQGSRLHLLCILHWEAGSLPLVPPGKPFMSLLKGKKKDHLSIKPCLGMLALSHSLGLSSYLLKVSCSLQPSHGLKGKTTSYKTEKMSRF